MPPNTTFNPAAFQFPVGGVQPGWQNPHPVGGLASYAAGQTVTPVEKMPWEDFAAMQSPPKEDTSSPNYIPPQLRAPTQLEAFVEDGPWKDYARNESGPIAMDSRPKRPLEKAKDFFGKVLDQTASALNTRPEQIVSGGKGSMPVIRPKTAEEEKLGPTNAANRARRTAGFLQGAVFDLPAAIAQMVPGKSAENVANAQLQGYNDFRSKLGGGDDLDVSRLVGNIASPVGIKGAGAIENLLAKTGAGLFKKGAVQGAAAGAATPVEPPKDPEEANFWGDKAMQIGGGSLLGGSLNKLFGKVDPNSIAGQKASNIDKYYEAFPEAKLSWGQNAGGRLNQLEQMMTSWPFAGQIIKEARNTAFDSQNVGMMKRALKDADIELDKGTQAGRGMFEQAYDKLTNKYSSLLEDARLPDPQTLRGKIFGTMDTGNGSSLATPDQLANSYQPGVISNQYNQLSEAGQNKFNKIIDSFFNRFGKDPQGNHSLPMSGNKFKEHEEDFKDTIDDFMSGGGEDRTIGKMLKKSLAEMYNSLESDVPGVANKLKKLNTSYAQYKVLENASTASGASNGRFTPVQTIKAATKRGRTQIARGKGLLQDEAQLSQDVLGVPYPDSGTAGRLNAGNPAANLVGGALSFPFELLASPTIATNVMRGGDKAKNAFQRSAIGSQLARGAPQGGSGAVRGLLAPSSSQIGDEDGEMDQQMYSTPELPPLRMASGGIAAYKRGERVDSRNLSAEPTQTGGGAFIGYPKNYASRKQGAISGFLEALMGDTRPGPSVLEPEYDQYAKGKKYGDLAGIAAMAAPGVGVGAAAARGPLNAIHYQATRGMRAPVFATETAVTNPSFLRNVELGDAAGMNASRSHLAQEAMRADPQLARRPFGEAQGAWQGSQGFEANPLFTQELPRHLGKVSDQDYMKYAAQLSKNLNQDANAVTRFTPQLISQMSRANAAQLSGITPEMIKEMGKAGLTNDMVIAARPGNKAIVMGFGDDAGQMKGLLDKVKEFAPKAKVKLGTSKQDADRVFMMKNDEGWAPTYESFGATKSEPLDFHKHATGGVVGEDGRHRGNIKASALIGSNVKHFAEPNAARAKAIYDSLGGANGIKGLHIINHEGSPSLIDGGHYLEAARHHLKHTGQDLDMGYIYAP